LQLNDEKGQGIKFITESDFFALLDATLPESERAPAPVTLAAPKLSAPTRVVSDVQSASSAPQSSTSNEQEGFNELWVDKYKPRGFEDLVGNQRELLALDDWLKKWDAIHLHSASPSPCAPQPIYLSVIPIVTAETLAPPKFSMQSNSGAKAVLISGPPGIGKTTTAALIAKRYGYDLFEMNASDARSKNKLKVSVPERSYDIFFITHKRNCRICSSK
jgi:replication factor C subunit 1